MGRFHRQLSNTDTDFGELNKYAAYELPKSQTKKSVIYSRTTATKNALMQTHRSLINKQMQPMHNDGGRNHHTKRTSEYEDNYSNKAKTPIINSSSLDMLVKHGRKTPLLQRKLQDQSEQQSAARTYDSNQTFGMLGRLQLVPINLRNEYRLHLKLMDRLKVLKEVKPILDHSFFKSFVMTSDKAVDQMQHAPHVDSLGRGKIFANSDFVVSMGVRLLKQDVQSIVDSQFSSSLTNL